MKKYLSSYWIRSAFYTILQRFSLTIFGLVTFWILIRQLSKEEMGVWALFLVITGIFEVTKSYIFKYAHIKFVSASSDRNEKAEIASSSLLINGSITFILILFILLFSVNLSSWLNAGRELGTMLIWFIPGLVMTIFFSHLEAMQQSHLDFKGVFAGYFARQVLFFLFIIVHVSFNIPFSLDMLALYQSISILAGTAVLYFFTRKYMLMRFIPSRAWIKKITGYGGYVFGSGAVATLFQNLDQLMVAKILGTVRVAEYNAAARINGLVDIPSYAAAEVLFPKASRASVEDGKERVKYLYERMVAILLSFTVPLALFIIIFPGPIIQIIAGSQYLTAAPILQLYMITGIIRPSQNQAANLLNSIGKPKLCFYLNVGYLAINLILNYICLKEFGFLGAAIGTVITFMMGAIVWYFVMKREIGFEVSKIVTHSIDVYRSSFKMVMGFLGKKEQKAVV